MAERSVVTSNSGAEQAVVHFPQIQGAPVPARNIFELLINGGGHVRTPLYLVEQAWGILAARTYDVLHHEMARMNRQDAIAKIRKLEAEAYPERRV